MSEQRPKRLTEYCWWAGVVLWVLALIFWHPLPVSSYSQVPSRSPKRLGYAIFYELAARQTKGVSRFLVGPNELHEDVGVVVILSPSKKATSKEQEELLDWVWRTGGTLIVGHPVLNGNDENTKIFGTAGNGLCPVKEVDSISGTIEFITGDANPSYEVPDMTREVSRVIDIDLCYGDAFLVADNDHVIATIETWGDGKVINIADASLLDNTSLGKKDTHLFAKALIDEAGTNTKWAFDESHEGVDPSPKIISIVGATRLRPVFLQIVLLVLLGYWWFARRLGRPVIDTTPGRMRDVVHQAKSTGQFYLRAQKSRWALSRSVEYLKLLIKERGAAVEAKKQALELVAKVEQELSSGTNNMERHVALIREIARRGQALSIRNKGKTK